MNDLALDILRLFPWFFAGLAILNALTGKWEVASACVGATILSVLIYAAASRRHGDGN